MSKIQVIAIWTALLFSYGCGASGTSNSNTSTNGPVEIKLDPNNMPAGLSTTPLPMNGTLPPGISLKPIEQERGKRVPGIPTEEEIKKGVQIGKTPIPGIDPEAARRQLGYPAANFNAPPRGNVVVKKRRFGGKP